MTSSNKSHFDCDSGDLGFHLDISERKHARQTMSYLFGNQNIMNSSGLVIHPLKWESGGRWQVHELDWWRNAIRFRGALIASLSRQAKRNGSRGYARSLTLVWLANKCNHSPSQSTTWPQHCSGSTQWFVCVPNLFLSHGHASRKAMVWRCGIKI